VADDANCPDTEGMGHDESATPASIREIVGVYHADGGVMGELRYVLGKARGTAHCALCDITHSTVRRKAAWDDACRTFPHPIRLVHLNERSPEEVAACTLGTPTVLVSFADGTYRTLMGPDDLELEGSVSAFFDALDRAVSRIVSSDDGLGAPGVSAG
jgi:hypothetical protein